MRTLRALFLLSLFTIFATAANAADVRTTHQVYSFIERAELKGFLENPLSASKPYSRTTVAKYLVEIQEHKEALSKIEKEQLKYFLFEFSDDVKNVNDEFSELENRYVPAWNPLIENRLFKRFNLFPNDRDILAFSGKGWDVYVNGMFGAEFSNEPFNTRSSEEGKQVVRSYGYEARVRYKAIDFAAWTTENQVYGDQAFVDSLRFPYQFGEGDADNFDFYETESSVSYQDDHFLVYFGKGENHWGFSRDLSLTLSDNGIPYTHLRLKGRLGPIEMSIIHANLIKDPPVITRIDTLDDGVNKPHYARKYLAAHRVQWDVTKRLQFGLFEQVYYGQREIELEYIPPILFFRGAEHYTRDQDNMLIGLDLRWIPVNKVSLFGVILLDELMSSELGTDFYTNKHGLQLGAKWIDPLWTQNSSLSFDYMAIRPYVYSHKYNINTADHYGIALASPGLPNSETIALDLRKRFKRELEVGLNYRRLRHGANTREGKNIGGDMNVPATKKGIKNVTFLGGDLHTWQRLGIDINVELMYGLFIKMEMASITHDLEYETGGEKSEDGYEYYFSFIWHPVR